jgi:hypothetical protein
MSSQGSQGGQDRRRDLRIGDAERTAAADELAEHYAQGRLSTEEHHERLDRIWAARTASDLAPVFDDLPGSAYRVPKTYATADGPGAGTDRPRTGRPYPGPPFGRPPFGRPPFPYGPPRRTGFAAFWGSLPGALKVLLALVIAAVVITHLPLVLIAVVVWLVLSHRHRRWQGYHQRR